MLHACFYTICLLFRYTSWHFYAFSGTNLLTSCHSASFLFSAVFVFQKWYTGNILGIGRNKFLKSYFTGELPNIRRPDGGGPRGPHTEGWCGLAPGRAALVWGHPGPLQLSPLRVLHRPRKPKSGGLRVRHSWYVLNISIIFDAPCLFLHHLHIVLLHFVALLCIFRN